ncbi:MFS transporter [Kitasatospora sp. NPDC057542]|uniref:MFS transporter n=1 Tax=Kitasatospora sp. NPDC057542 TaxID=3346162 RepID=UPI003698E6B5
MKADPIRRDPHFGVRAVLAVPHVPHLLLASLVGRLPVASAPLAILLCAVAAGSGYLWASVVAGLYGLAATIGQPMLGRLVDRHGQRLPLIAAATTSATAMIALAVLDPRQRLLTAGASVAAGFATPPLEGALRALWSQTVPQRLQTAAFSLDVAAQSLLFALGPLLVSATVALSGPGTALMLIAALGVAGTWTMTTSAPSRAWQPPPAGPTNWMGPMRSRELRGIAGVLLLVGTALGAQGVAGTAWADSLGDRTSAGVLLGAFSAGSCMGGLAFSRRRGSRVGDRTLLGLVAGFTLGWAPLVVAPPSLAVMALLALVPGLCLSPLLGVVFERAGRTADPGCLTETFSWLVAAVGIGSAIGTALAGPLADHHGAAASYALALLAAAAGLGRLATCLAAAARAVPNTA